MRRTPRRALGLLAVCVLAGCAAPASFAGDKCGEPLQADPGELRTVLRQSAFGEEAQILGTAALHDGRVVVTYDANPEEAGGEEDWAPDPGIVLMAEGGSCTPFPLPTVDGLRLALDAQPAAVDRDGRLYLWDHEASRLVRGQVGGGWESVATGTGELRRWAYTPTVAVGGSGEIYIASGGLVYRVGETGGLEPVAGTTADPNVRGPALSSKDFPRPARKTPLSGVGGLAVTPAGRVVFTTRYQVFELAPDGTLDLLADASSTKGQDGAIVAEHGDSPGSNLSAVVVTEDESTLVSDLPQKRILEIEDGRSTVALHAPTYVHLSRGNAVLADGAGLLVHQDGGQSLAVYGLRA